MAASGSEILIAVMGATGVGKSSFVRLVTGDDSVIVGRRLSSETNRVSSHTFSYGGLDFALVDTPGFDDTWVDDRDVLRTLSLWLSDTYQDNRKLCGIIYLHRISDPRIQGSALRNLYMFKKLCGEDSFKHIVLGTTFWDTFAADPSVAEARQIELVEKDEFWGAMVRKGSEVCKIPQDQTKARDLLLEMARKGRTTLNLQRELVDNGKGLGDTEVYQMLPGIKKLVKEHEQQMKTMVEKNEQELMALEERAQQRSETQQERLEAKLREELAIKEKLKQDYDEKMAQFTKEIEELKLRPKQAASKTHSVIVNQEEVMSKTSLDRTPSSIPSQEPFISWQEHRAMEHKRFRNEIGSTMELLNHQQIGGKVVCKFRPSRRVNWAYCHNCFQTIGMGLLYGCPICYEGQFQLCATCYETPGVSCDDPAHRCLMRRGRQTNDRPFCKRINSPPQQGVLACSSCKAAVGSCFLHCCECNNDNFDLCLACVMKGRKCKKLASSSGHPMSIFFRYMGSKPT